MQTPNHPPPKFSSFAPSTAPSLASVAGPSRPRENFDEDGSRTSKRRRHHSRGSQTSDRARHSDDNDSDKTKKRRGRDRQKNAGERSRPNRREELRAMDKIASRPAAVQLQDRTRRPSQYTLDDSGLTYYDDPYGSTGTLFLEIKYWPLGQVRQVLGVPSIVRVSRDTKRSTFEAHIPFHFKTRKDVLRQFKAAAKVKTRRLLISEPRTLRGEEDGFIPVGKLMDTQADTNAPDYRAITQLKDTTSDDSESDEENNAGIDSDDEDTTDAYSAETARLARILSQDLTNVPAWLDVITHSASTNPTPQGRAEIWLTMLEKALSAHPLNRQSDTLRLRYLEAVRDAKTSENEDAAWERALLDIQSENLWVEYISYRLAKYGPDELESAVTRVWRELSRSDFPPERRFFAQLRVFWRALLGFHQAGYLERATSILQAQVELTYFTPAVAQKSPFEQVLDQMEEFWDSEAPRIGEPGAEGWASWKSSQSAQHATSLESLKEVIGGSVQSTNSPEVKSDGYQKWAIVESKMDAHGWLSVREDTDDPYSTVLFSDIRSFLFPPLSAPHHLSLLFVALQTLGLHIPGLSASLLHHNPHSPSFGKEDIDSVWSYTHFMNKPDLLGALFAIPSSSNGKSAPVAKRTSIAFDDELLTGTQRQMGTGWGPVKEWSRDTRSLFEGHGLRGEGRMWEEADLEGADVPFIRRIFRTMDSRIKSPEWAEYWIAFEAAVNMKEALKLSKTLLASYPSSLRLWSAHAHLQRIRGKSDAARKVYETCLTHSTSSTSWTSVDELNAHERASMWLSWAEMEWLNQDTAAAVRVLCAAVDLSPSQDASDARFNLLRARGAYNLVLRSGAVDGHTKAALLQCMALLELIYTNDVPRTLKVFSDNSTLAAEINNSAESQALEERLAVGSALLIYRHTQILRNANRPVDFRNHISHLMTKFSGNTLLLGVWLESERGEALWGRVRNGVADVVLGGVGSISSGPTRLPVTVVSVVRWTWAVWVETWERGAWDAGRARRAIRRALEDPRLRRCPSLWKLLLELEIRLDGNASVHGLVYQASVACPWVKDFYMYAFRVSRPQFSAEELRRTVNTMAEHAIRLRAMHSLESYLVDSKSGTDDNNDSDDDWGETEIEHRASELARLKPY